MNADQTKGLSEIGTLFSGEFDTVLIESDEPPKVIDAAAGIVLPPKHLTELDRLAATVRQIDCECFSVPRGSMKLTPLHQVTCNEAFKGLKKGEASSLEGWQHMRQPQSQEQVLAIERLEAVYTDCFLDPVAKDKPNQCWSIIKDATESVSTLRSQLWPGYYGYHRCNTAIYGSVYIGDGIKNIDLPFML